MSPAIEVEGLTKLYARYATRRRFATLKSAFLGARMHRELTPEAVFPAVRDLSFSVAGGKTVAVIGPNGSGKSTLLKVLAGILRPTHGRVRVHGRVAALLELGAGFHPEVSGRENIVINGIMLGLSRREIERRLPEVVRFAELEEFIDAPVKTYSSGMYVRLGFSVAVAVEPDVLLVDEVLAVGDEAFSHKCLERFRDLRRRGRTVLLVTHALDLVEALADEAILLEGGRLAARGEPRQVVGLYRGHVEERERDQGPPLAAAAAPAAQAEASADPWEPARWGNGEVTFTAVRLLDALGHDARLLRTGDALTVALEVAAAAPVEDFVFGIAFRTREGVLAYGSNTHIDGLRPRRLAGPARVEVRFPALTLLEGSYALDVAVHRADGTPFDYRRACLTFQVRSPRREVGLARLEHAWRFAGEVAID